MTEDLVVGADYTHRWLNAVIEDGVGASDGAYVLANPGQVPQSTLDGLQNDINDKMKQVNAASDPTDKAIKQSELGLLQSKQANLKGLGAEPKPERTYDALTFSATKRLARSWMFQGSYTYSRLIGNYNGLYDADANYFAPNGSTQFDTADLVLNKRGPLANDRPHSGRLDAFYQHDIGKGTLIAGASFAAFSGVPRNYVGGLYGSQVVFILPRGSAGRTPTVTQTDIKLAYRMPVTKNTSIETFLDMYNIFNERTTLQTDDNYTFDSVAAIVNGTKNDLPFAKNAGGAPVLKNPNFGQATAFQQPFHGRMGVRFLF